MDIVGRRVEDFTDEGIRLIEARMRDEGFSSSRFLGDDESLVACIASDHAVLECMGITHDQIADRLESLHGREMREQTLRRRAQGTGSRPSDGRRRGEGLEGRFAVSERAYMGHQWCPFEYRETEERISSCGQTNHDLSIANRATGKHLVCSGLMIHLIRAHHFFEGRGLTYRLDPAHAVDVLELRPGVNYAPVFGEEVIWSKRRYSPGIGQARPRPDPSWPREEPVSGIEIYRRPDGGCLVRVAEGCRCRAIEFDGAIMELDGAGAYEFGGKEIIGFVC